MVNPSVFFDIALVREPLGCVSFKLFADKIPKTKSAQISLGLCHVPGGNSRPRATLVSSVIVPIFHYFPTGSQRLVCG
uniref:Uncharacterized protein n=1 Tax=Canis lupus familiaris TaxID=9615 RepID=A0A8C0S8F4_CANLF